MGTPRARAESTSICSPIKKRLGIVTKKTGHGDYHRNHGKFQFYICHLKEKIVQISFPGRAIATNCANSDQ
ncbi:hypothetical protein [Rivularia sp. UHCC 0363]|uniref:hypothetical protein n=1 Tax=Rivularia sp. UHCC 0363 TaxID=3110244 RepID=UPI002B1FE5AE|nr:hypothetical protein [Rivularia sp. UHCC 0363]MEA5597252.1 hypothetical protein [Rivularia sp. UHCC 0363]